MVELSTLLLLKEAQDLFDDGKTDDALAVARAVADADPSFPDVWIDIAAILRAKASAGRQPEAVEREALDADRQLVAHGSHIPDLAAAVAVAKAHIIHREGWDRHLASHVAVEEQRAAAEAARKAQAAAAAAEHKANLERRAVEEEDRIKREIAEIERLLAKPKRNRRRVTRKEMRGYRKAYHGKQLRFIKWGLANEPNEELGRRVMDLRSRLSRVRSPGIMMDTYGPAPARSYVHIDSASLLKDFDYMRRAGKSCECGTRLDADPPPPIDVVAAWSPPPT